MIDLGAWATESYRIPIQDDDDKLGTEDPGHESPRS